MCDDEDFNDDDSEKLTDIQLGFVKNDVNRLFLEKDWTKWDGGKVGGKPIWLDKSIIPSAASLECKFCGDPNLFLLQIYCPLDDYDASAFHRCLYVFCCRKATCNEKGSIQCLRSQLPKENQYYRSDPKSLSLSLTNSELDSVTVPGPVNGQQELRLCALCGVQGTFSCSACTTSANPVRYCSKRHQQMDWKYHKQVCGKADCTVGNETDTNAAGQLHHKRILTFTEYDISIEEEVLEGGGEDEDEDEDEDGLEVGSDGKYDIAKALKSSKINPDTIIWEDAVTEGGEDEKADADLKQGDYEKALGNQESDPRYSRFLSRVRRGGDKQVLRYYCGPRASAGEAAADDDGQREAGGEMGVEDKRGSSDNMPLAVSSVGYVDPRAIPPCDYCQSPRVFEFQIMPQLLHFLKVDQGTQINRLKCLDRDEGGGVEEAAPVSDKDVFFNKTNEDIDWGTIDVFTCSRSCAPPSEVPYMSEFCWRQPPPVVSGHQLQGPSSSNND